MGVLEMSRVKWDGSDSPGNRKNFMKQVKP